MASTDIDGDDLTASNLTGSDYLDDIDDDIDDDDDDDDEGFGHGAIAEKIGVICARDPSADQPAPPGYTEATA